MVLAARSVTELEEVAAEARAGGVKALAVPTDVVDRVALKSLVSSATREFGAIDVLVNNAGIARPVAYDRLQVEEIERMVRVNLTAPMLLTWMVLQGMVERQRGHIVNMSSLAGKVGPPYTEPYAATKAGLIGFTESLRTEYRGTGVSASVICPGFVEEAGLYQQVSEKTGLVSPLFLGTVSPKAVAHAVVRAIKGDIPEIIVNPTPIRLFTTLAELSPSLGEWGMLYFGVADGFRKAAELLGGGDTQPKGDT